MSQSGWNLRDFVIEAMEQALKDWDDGVVWVDTTRLVADGTKPNVRYAPSEFAYKFGDRVAEHLEQLMRNGPPPLSEEEMEDIVIGAISTTRLEHQRETGG